MTDQQDAPETSQASPNEKPLVVSFSENTTGSFERKTFWDKYQNIIIIGLIVVAAVIIIFILWNRGSKNANTDFWSLPSTKFGFNRENFDDESIDRQSVALPEYDVTEGEMVALPEVRSEQQPFVDPKTGTLISGPGYETTEVETPYSDIWSNVPSNYYFLDDGAGGEMSIQNNLCSKSCCSSQWPTPFKTKNDPYVCANKDQFVPSNVYCNNSFQDAGCLCLTKKQGQFLYNRGGNGREWF